jgi:serine/threonine protein kinase/Tol biopolymer transport system component
MNLTAGTQFGPYEIASFVGSGGMGDVYRSRDSRLGRDVALKILPAEFSANPDRVARFEGEARSASALNHPNIVTIYEIGSIDSHSFIAMEYVDGPTLRESLQSGPLPLRQAIHIAAQLAEGLANAHEAGIVHRDLKPENVVITREGYAKILDFGLAKISIPVDREQLSALPTAVKTEPGIVLGTVGYMSPEQASGRIVDFRADQFSLGAILYEMVTGRRAFHKNTSVETLSAIINDDPEPVHLVNPRVAAPIRWIIERCVAKNPQDRYIATRDLARDLANIRQHASEIVGASDITTHPDAGSRRRSRRVTEVIALSLIVILASALLFAVRRGEKTPITYHRLTYRRGPISSARFTPDGHTIVYDARWEGAPRELFVTRPDAIESRPLGIRGAEVLSVSAAGEMLVLRTQDDNRRTLAAVSVTGGTPRELAVDILGADWSPDGSRMVVARSINGKSRLEFPPGTTLYESPSVIEDLRFSPAGDRIAFIEHLPRSVNGKVLILNVNGKLIADSGTCYPLGIAWHSADELWFTTESGVPGGGSQLYALGQSSKTRYIAPFVRGTLDDISTNGDALVGFDDRSTIAQGVPAGADTETHLTWLDLSEVADISSDAKKVLIHERGDASESPNGTIYVENMDGSGGVRLDAGQPTEFSPDGKWVLSNPGKPKTFSIVPVGPGTVREFEVPSENSDVNNHWVSNFEVIGFRPPDGRDVLVWSRDSDGGTTIWAQNTGGGQPTRITRANVQPMRGRTISPDGRLVIASVPDDRRFVLLSLEDGKVQPLPGLESGEEPIQWARGGRSIFVYERNRVPASIFRVDVVDGTRVPFKQITPSDRVGVQGLMSVRIASDEQTYAYSFIRNLSSLYLIKGLH